MSNACRLVFSFAPLFALLLFLGCVRGKDCPTDPSDPGNCPDLESGSTSPKYTTCADVWGTSAASRTLCLTDHRVQEACPCVCDFVKCGEKPRPTDPPTDAPTRAPERQTNPPDPEEEEFPEPAAAETCFHGSSTVETNRGPMSMVELKSRSQDDGSLRVRSIDAQNRLVWSPVNIWMHADPEQVASFVDVTTENGKQLSLTDSHLIYSVPCHNAAERHSKLAGDLKEGECILVNQDGSVVASKVVSLIHAQKTGVYAFSTDTGSVVVDGVAASCYASLPYESLTHWFFTKLYTVQQMVPACLVNGDNVQVHPLITSLVQSASKYFR